MYSPTSRVLTVLELLQARQQMSGPEIAAQLEIDVRTVRRYITILQDLGIPVETEIGRNGGYHLRTGFKLPPLMFTDKEAVALAVGLLMAHQLNLDEAAISVAGAFAKIERILPSSLQEQVQAIQNNLTFENTNNPSKIVVKSEVLVIISRAIQQSCRVVMFYNDGKGVSSQRLFDPYGLVSQNGRWYTAGYCHLRNDLRVFRLDRIEQATLTSEEFVRPTDFDTLKYAMQSFAAIPDKWNVKVQLQLTFEEAIDKVPSMLATLEEVEANRIIMCASIHDLKWMAHFLVGLGCAFIVCEPPQLRATLQALALEINFIATQS